jgi:predicted CXXCH cytochrome family protein
MNLARLLLAASLSLPPLVAFAAGGHDAIGCTGCHPRAAVKSGFVLEPNTKYLDPATGQPYPGSTAVCLACHQDPDKGGQGIVPVSRHDSHPFGLATIDPKVAKVPADMLKNGRFECMSCHDPHPSNRNWKYLRVDVGEDGGFVDRFCAACHPRKADPNSPG